CRFPCSSARSFLPGCGSGGVTGGSPAVIVLAALVLVIGTLALAPQALRQFAPAAAQVALRLVAAGEAGFFLLCLGHRRSCYFSGFGFFGSLLSAGTPRGLSA